MLPTFKPPNILRLALVTLADCVSPEDLLDRRLADSVEGRGGAVVAAHAVKTYDKPPAAFTSLDEWPLSTNLLCWDSGLPIPGRPAFVPSAMIQDEDGNISIGVRGLVMSFSNASHWITAHLTGAERDSCRNLLAYAFTAMYPSKPHPVIRDAPSRTEMQQYGGDLEPEEYLQKIAEIDPAAAEHGLKNTAMPL